MALNNITDSAFDPTTLQPAGSPSRQPFGVSSGDLGQSFITQTPMTGPDGRTYVMQQIENPDGTKSPPQFVTAGPDGSTVKITQTQDGRWIEGNWEKEGFAKTVFGDKKLMAFLAVAGGVGAAAAASGAAGGGGMALGSGTGATPGVVAGGTSGTAGLSGGGLVSAGAAGAGSAAPIVEATPSAAGGSAVTTPGAGAAGGTAASTAATSTATQTALAPASSWWQSVFSDRVVGGIVSGIGSGIAGHLQQRAESERAREDRDWRSAEAERERQWRVRNFSPDAVARIDWSRIQQPGQVAMPQMRPSEVMQPVDFSRHGLVNGA